MSDFGRPTANRRSLILGAAGGVAAAAIPARAAGLDLAEPPSIVLVHGAFTDASCWSEVILLLQRRGHRVSAVQNPLTSLADDVAATRRVLERHKGPVLLVGHSWGGAVITEAGMASNVAALVYVSALAPDEGESVAELQKHGPPGPAMAVAAPDAHGDLWFDPDRYHAGLAGDIPAARASWMAAAQQPIAARCFEDRLSAAAWRSKPSHYLLSQNDQALSPVLQRWMATRMRAMMREVASSHMSPVAQPAIVASLIASAAEGAVTPA